MSAKLRTVFFTLGGLAYAATGQAQDIPKQPGEQSPSDRSIQSEDLTPMSGADMNRAFRGQIMQGVYKNPRARSGTQFFTESFNRDGTTDYKEGTLTDRAQWRTSGDQLCFDYQGEMAGPPSCFSVFQLGSCYYSYNPEEVFYGKPLLPNRWSVKSKLSGALSTCEDLMS